MFKYVIMILGLSVVGAQTARAQSVIKMKDPAIEQFFKANKNFSLKKDFTVDVERLFEKDESPAYLKGDFDGDGVSEDHILLVQDKKNEYLCLILSTHKNSKGKCRVIQKGKDRYLSFISKKDAKFLNSDISPRDVYQLEYYLGETTAFYIDKGKEKVFEGEIVSE